MLRFVDYDILFQEVPDEVTLAINLSGCPYRCKGCHSSQLQTDIGEELNEDALTRLLERYGEAVTCLCFMGGDAEPEHLCRLAAYARKLRGGAIHTAWYSGSDRLYERARSCFDFVKIGPYIEALGGLDRPGSNQRLYRIQQGRLTDITGRLQHSQVDREKIDF